MMAQGSLSFEVPATAPLGEILDGLSRLTGYPLILVDRHGEFAGLPRCHPARCPLSPTAGESGCPVAQKILSRPVRLRGLCTLSYRGTTHVAAPVHGARGLQALVIADGWNPRLQRRRGRRVNLGRMRDGAALAAAMVGHLCKAATPLAPGGAAPFPSPVPRHGPLLDLSSRALRTAVERGWLSDHGLRRLRQEYRMTWREIEILALYYLIPSAWWSDNQEPSTRRLLANHLHLTEGTLRAYLNGIRAKLGLRARRGALSFWLWARAEGILSPDYAL